ncbi:hypothetical protein ACHAPJ_012482 [Fusarium lateritium]
MGKSVAIVGAGVFGISIAISLRDKGYTVSVFDRNPYDETDYDPTDDRHQQSASVDHNKIFRASYGTKLHYQRLALESRQAWLAADKEANAGLFAACGMLRVQPTDQLGALEKETLANMERDGLRDTQFVKDDSEDRKRATELGWEPKLLDFSIPDNPKSASFAAVLDSLGGFTQCSKACAHFQKVAKEKGVTFYFGPKTGAIDSLVEEESPVTTGLKQAVGLKTKDGVIHKADSVVIAAGSCSTQLLPDLSYHLESSGGSVVTFKIDENDTKLWDKYSPEKFPVITWKSAPRSEDGKDTGSVYVFPRTPDGLIKIGYRGIKFTNFQPAPEGTPFTQDGQWSIPLDRKHSTTVPQPAVDAIRRFVSIFLPEFTETSFHSQKLCWYTDSLDNSFVIDYVPHYAKGSVFVCTGGSGHGAKFMPVLGEHAADIFHNGDASTSYMRPFWRWRETAPRRNGLEEGPGGSRNLGNHSFADE